MPTNAFYWLLNMSIVASAAGLVILLLRLIPRLPRGFLYPLWAIVLLRLYLPFGFASDFSILRLLPHRVVSLPENAALFGHVQGMNCTMAAVNYYPVVFKSQTLEAIFRIAAGLWIAVAAVLLVTVLLSYIQTLRQARRAAHWKENLYLTDAATAPMVVGIFRPRILLPTDWRSGQSELILLHERIHIRRLDNLWRLIALLTACIHWFNPLIWLFLRCFLTDLELSCDEAVLRSLTPAQRTDYAHTLLDSLQRRSLLASPFGHARTPQRIRNILSYRNLSWGATLLLCVAAACISAALLTNAK